MILEEMDDLIAKAIVPVRGWSEIGRRRAVFIAGMREAGKIQEKIESDKKHALDVVFNTADQLEREARIASMRR